jgi:hypothetical protein
MRPHLRLAIVFSFALICSYGPAISSAEAGEAEAFHGQLDAFPVVVEVDTATAPPVYEFPTGTSSVTNLLGRRARVLPMDGAPKAIAYVVGAHSGLKPGAAYVLSIEYPDDVPRTIFIANRGADQVRGFATGSATGDVRQQYTQPSLESLSYPQSGQWQRYRALFVLHHRFQGVQAQRSPKPGGRVHTPADGFHVVIFQSHRLNDPPSRGAALGKIRLHAIPDLAALVPAVELPPPGLPRRHVFFREEMGDEPVSAAADADRGYPDPVEWYLAKARLARVLGVNTFAKDLLEFGFNQGWDSGDQNWVMNAQPPMSNLWDRLAPLLADAGLELLPYYEYKGALGLRSANPVSLGWQRRAEKLYHGRPNTNYSGTAWVEQHNADLTDPDTLADAKRLLDRTVLAHKASARFAGVWFRTRGNHLPISFAEATLNRFKAAQPANAPERDISRERLIASYESDGRLYQRYLDWWLGKRAAFFGDLQEYVAKGLGGTPAVLFTPWPGETVPLLRDPASGTNGHPVQITSDDPPWWEALARSQTNGSWFRWALVPRPFNEVVSGNYYGKSLAFHEPISRVPWRHESYHAAPNADPENYRSAPQVMITYPIGRLFTVAQPDTLEAYRSQAGLTVVHHYPLNEDNPDDRDHPGPFGGLAGYTCVDVDRAGPYVCLLEARAVANGDPVNIGYLSGSTYSSGFPGQVRRFHQAFLSVPALPSVRLDQASADTEVVVREIAAGKHGTYYYVVNTSMNAKRAVTIRLPKTGQVRDLVSRVNAPDGALRLDLDPGELRSYHVTPPGK